jgi:hypothetical protein
MAGKCLHRCRTHFMRNVLCRVPRSAGNRSPSSPVTSAIPPATELKAARPSTSGGRARQREALRALTAREEALGRFIALASSAPNVAHARARRRAAARTCRIQ